MSWFGLSRQDKQWLKGVIMSAAQDVIDAVTTELDTLDQPLATILTAVDNLVAGNPVDTTALQAAADQIKTAVGSIATAVGTTPPPAVQ
jgi:hypothetical protein